MEVINGPQAYGLIHGFGDISEGLLQATILNGENKALSVRSLARNGTVELTHPFPFVAEAIQDCAEAHVRAQFPIWNLSKEPGTIGRTSLTLRLQLDTMKVRVLAGVISIPSAETTAP